MILGRCQGANLRNFRHRPLQNQAKTNILAFSLLLLLEKEQDGQTPYKTKQKQLSGHDLKGMFKGCDPRSLSMCALPRVTEFLLATGLRQVKGEKRELEKKDCYILRYHEVKRAKRWKWWWKWKSDWCESKIKSTLSKNES